MGDVELAFPEDRSRGRSALRDAVGRTAGGSAGTGPSARGEEMIARQNKVQFGVKLAGMLEKGQTLQDVVG